MMRRTIAVAASFAALLAAADAQPKTPDVAQPAKPTKPSLADRKAAKKEMDIARHEWTAQYDAVHLHDLARLVRLADRVAVHMQPVADYCLHIQHLLVPVRSACGPAHTLGVHRSVPSSPCTQTGTG